MAGQFKPGEPAEIDILKSAVNTPSETYIFKLKEEEFPLVELGFIHSKTYLVSLLPTIENSLKDMAPLINAISNSWFYLRNFSNEAVEAIRLTALDPQMDNAAIREIFNNWGAPGLSDAIIEELKNVAVDPIQFSNKVGSLFMKPLIDSLKELNISDLVLKAIDKLPDLVLASFAASQSKRGLTVRMDKLKEDIINNMDVFDLLNVALGQIQLYKDSGKWGASFFDPMKKLMGMTSPSTETPTA